MNYIRPGNTFWNMLRSKIIAKPVKPATKPPIVHAFMVCEKVKPEKRLITQKPESLGRDKPTPPQQIAKPTRIGEAPMDSIDGATIAAVVTRATVAEPWAARRIWLRVNPRMMSGTLKSCIVATM